MELYFLVQKGIFPKQQISSPIGFSLFPLFLPQGGNLTINFKFKFITKTDCLLFCNTRLCMFTSFPEEETVGFEKMDGLMKMAAWLVALANILNAARGETNHHVGGGKNNWGPNVNLTEWSSHEHFYVRDWLYFGFDKNMYNVLEVNETSYENCVDSDFVTNITKGGRDVCQLKEVRTYFFISGRGFCFHGLKVAVNVEDVPPQPSPSPSKNASPSISCCRISLLLAAFWTFVSPFILLLG